MTEESNCCYADTTADCSAEGTCCYICKECQQPCDVAVSNKQICFVCGYYVEHDETNCPERIQTNY